MTSHLEELVLCDEVVIVFVWNCQTDVACCLQTVEYYWSQWRLMVPTGQSWNGATLQCEAVFQTGRVRKVDIFTGTSIPDISLTGYLLMFSAQLQKNSWEHNRITEKWQFWGLTPEASGEDISFIFIIRCEKRMTAHSNCNSTCCIIKNTGLGEACFFVNH